ncbi:hypothetical protein [Dactylosporangium sp. CA-092794]|uniref:hypothetical protein n=1 Tax=Dactylosporangium sp. CA-092794 TaxID=3239929 RepID=UPI003D8B89F4
MAPTDRTRRFGYAIAVFINLVILYVLNVRPEWQAAPFLTDATPRVLVLVNLSLLAGIIANAIYIAADGPWVKTLGDLTTTTIGLAVLIRIWQVFPFDFTAWTFDWALAARIVLVVALIGTGIALFAQAVALLRLAVGRLGHPGGHALP